MSARLGEPFDFGLPTTPPEYDDDLLLEDTDIEYDAWKDDRLDPQRDR